jgi:hypothetical protein
MHFAMDQNPGIADYPTSAEKYRNPQMVADFAK